MPVMFSKQFVIWVSIRSFAKGQILETKDFELVSVLAFLSWLLSRLLKKEVLSFRECVLSWGYRTFAMSLFVEKNPNFFLELCSPAPSSEGAPMHFCFQLMFFSFEYNSLRTSSALCWLGPSISYSPCLSLLLSLSSSPCLCLRVC